MKERELEVITPRKSKTKPVVYTFGKAKPEPEMKKTSRPTALLRWYFHFGVFWVFFAPAPLIVSSSLETSYLNRH